MDGMTLALASILAVTIFMLFVLYLLYSILSAIIRGFTRTTRKTSHAILGNNSRRRR